MSCEMTLGVLAGSATVIHRRCVRAGLDVEVPLALLAGIVYDDRHI
jgi:hypothetical protein